MYVNNKSTNTAVQEALSKKTYCCLTVRSEISLGIIWTCLWAIMEYFLYSKYSKTTNSHLISLILTILVSIIGLFGLLYGKRVYFKIFMAIFSIHSLIQGVCYTHEFIIWCHYEHPRFKTMNFTDFMYYSSPLLAMYDLFYRIRVLVLLTQAIKIITLSKRSRVTRVSVPSPVQIFI